MAPASTSSMILHDVRLASYGSTSTIKPSKGKGKAAASSTPFFPLSASTHPHLTPEALATAGFFYDPRPDESSLDTCKCFLCGLKLGGWDEEDDPFEEHVKRGNCAWADFVCLPLITRRKGESHEFLTAASLPSSAQSTVNREATYMKQWPHKQKSGWLPTIKNLAKAGFVYNPTSDSRDSVVCPYCEYAVEGWEATDDPQAVHYNKSPECVFFTATLDNAESSGSKPPSKPKTTRRQTKAGSQRSKRNTTAISGSQAPSEVDESVGEEIEKSAAPAPRATRKGRTRVKAVDEESVAEEEPEAGPSKPAKPKTTRKTKAAVSPLPVEAPSEADEEEVIVVKKTKSGKERKQTRKAQAEQETSEEQEDVGEDGDATMKADVVEPEPASKPARKPRATRAKATTESQGAEGEEKQKKPRAMTKGKKGKKVETDVEKETMSVAESAVEEEEAEQPKSTSGRKKASSKTGAQGERGESSQSSRGDRTARTKAKPVEVDTELDAGAEVTESEAEPAATEDETESVVQPEISKKSKKSSSSNTPSSKPSSASESQRSKPSSRPPPAQPIHPTSSQLDMFSNIPPSSPIRPGPQHKSAPARAVASGHTGTSSHKGENTPRPKATLVTAKPARPSPHQNLNRDTLDRSVLQGALEARKVMEDLLVNETLAPKPAPNANGKEVIEEDGEGERRVLSESQKKMTLADLVRMEFKSRYEEMERQGRNMISQWEQKAKESRLKIEQI